MEFARENAISICLYHRDLTSQYTFDLHLCKYDKNDGVFIY